MRPHAWTLTAICGALAFPLSACAQGFNCNTVGQVQSGHFRADRSAAVLIGQPAIAQDDVDVGNVVDVIHDEEMMVRGYIVNVGGFLGIDATPVFFPASRASAPENQRREDNVSKFEQQVYDPVFQGLPPPEYKTQDWLTGG